MKIVSRTKTGDPFLDLSIAKMHMRIGFADDDTIVKMYADAATDWLERVCNTSLIASDYVLTGDAINLALPGYSNMAIADVEYVDDLGVTVPVLDHSVINGRLVADIPKTAQNVTVRLSTAPMDGLESLQQAGYMIAAAFYEEPSNITNYSVSHLPFGVRQLIAPFRSFAH